MYLAVPSRKGKTGPFLCVEPAWKSVVPATDLNGLKNQSERKGMGVGRRMTFMSGRGGHATRSRSMPPAPAGVRDSPFSTTVASPTVTQSFGSRPVIGIIAINAKRPLSEGAPACGRKEPLARPSGVRRRPRCRPGSRPWSSHEALRGRSRSDGLLRVAECLLESVSHLGWVGVVVARSGDVGLTGGS